ncbi:uncharacterized protein LOC118205579, partial [Stegodyphus dumicola]|uniref:uncharacterized protein LOC118205579 n=1 Tax=Stegodyphus dumicola TaxID=202533 RepID=UPI0015B144EC
MPRLELLACLIGARLTATVKEAKDLKGISSTCWTESSTVMFLIKREDNWGTFVHNRVKEIRNLTLKEQWKHIPGSDNLADLPSRGCSAGVLLRSKWWEGPPWLKQPEENWLKQPEENWPGFADASEKAFGAVIYLQSITSPGEYCSKLLCSKSRVAPIKTMTIPRLELSACLLLSKLMQK